MSDPRLVKYVIFDKVKRLYLSRNGIGFGWSFHRVNAARLNSEQAVFWTNQLIQINQRRGFVVQEVGNARAV
ncbi:hypothetical protein [Anabaena lutea]|uniref:Uncharacterized protein n=1 Tax=Anabaena lutea FACHB-196 TaxID=2692881 RepID=A0ABR8FMU0_9NOST|nr:hypothetical protein [Anabaena lutea]MBD2570026.1 hypothetical protein [Anabaena lutea FACHB-196]